MANNKLAELHQQKEARAMEQHVEGLRLQLKMSAILAFKEQTAQELKEASSFLLGDLTPEDRRDLEAAALVMRARLVEAEAELAAVGEKLPDQNTLASTSSPEPALTVVEKTAPIGESGLVSNGDLNLPETRKALRDRAAKEHGGTGALAGKIGVSYSFFCEWVRDRGIKASKKGRSARVQKIEEFLGRYT